MRAGPWLLAAVLLQALVSAAAAQGFTQGGFAGSAGGHGGGYGAGYGGFGARNGNFRFPPIEPQAGVGLYGQTNGLEGTLGGGGRVLPPYGLPNGASGRLSGANSPGRRARDDGVRFGGAGGQDFGHGVHLGNGAAAGANSPYGAGGGATGPFVSPAYGNEEWHPNYFPGD